jgi:hypothetical protein
MTLALIAEPWVSIAFSVVAAVLVQLSKLNEREPRDAQVHHLGADTYLSWLLF